MIITEATSPIKATPSFCNIDLHLFLDEWGRGYASSYKTDKHRCWLLQSPFPWKIQTGTESFCWTDKATPFPVSLIRAENTPLFVRLIRAEATAHFLGLIPRLIWHLKTLKRLWKWNRIQVCWFKSMNIYTPIVQCAFRIRPDRQSCFLHLVCKYEWSEKPIFLKASKECWPPKSKAQNYWQMRTRSEACDLEIIIS